MLIHIIYDRPQTDGATFDPLKGTIRFLGPKPDGWSYGEEMPLTDLPEEQAPIYLALAGAIQGKGGNWVATQVWAQHGWPGQGVSPGGGSAGRHRGNPDIHG